MCASFFTLAKEISGIVTSVGQPGDHILNCCCERCTVQTRVRRAAASQEAVGERQQPSPEGTSAPLCPEQGGSPGPGSAHLAWRRPDLWGHFLPGGTKHVANTLCDPGLKCKRCKLALSSHLVYVRKCFFRVASIGP